MALKFLVPLSQNWQIIYHHLYLHMHPPRCYMKLSQSPLTKCCIKERSLKRLAAILYGCGALIYTMYITPNLKKSKKFRPDVGRNVGSCSHGFMMTTIYLP